MLESQFGWLFFTTLAHGGRGARRVAAQRHGRVVQVDPIKPKLNLPGTKRFKLTCDILLSTSVYKFNLRRYIMVQVNTSGEESKFGVNPEDCLSLVGR
jgi:hypothetical protein